MHWQCWPGQRIRHPFQQTFDPECSGHNFASAVGTPAKLIELATHRQQRCLRGLAAARRVFEAKAATT